MKTTDCLSQSIPPLVFSRYHHYSAPLPCHLFTFTVLQPGLLWGSEQSSYLPLCRLSGHLTSLRDSSLPGHRRSIASHHITLPALQLSAIYRARTFFHSTKSLSDYTSRPSFSASVCPSRSHYTYTFSFENPLGVDRKIESTYSTL